MKSDVTSVSIEKKLTDYQMASEIYDRCRDYIKHEDTLIHNRTQSVLLSQAFLIAGVTLLMQSVSETASNMENGNYRVDSIILEHTETLKYAICVLGLLTAACGGYSIIWAMKAIEGVKEYWNKSPYGNSHKDDFPSLTGGNNDHWFRLDPGLLASSFCIVFWISVFLYSKFEFFDGLEQQHVVSRLVTEAAARGAPSASPPSPQPQAQPQEER